MWRIHSSIWSDICGLEYPSIGSSACGLSRSPFDNFNSYFGRANALEEGCEATMRKNNAANVLDPTRRSRDAAEFESALRRKIVGQDQAIEKVAEIYQTFVAGLNPPGRPIGNLLFLGPTGTGKTRVVEAMAEAMFGDPHACIKIDCGEFQHSHEIAKAHRFPSGIPWPPRNPSFVDARSTGQIAHRKAQAVHLAH
jgi:hypothetical protein